MEDKTKSKPGPKPEALRLDISLDEAVMKLCADARFTAIKNGSGSSGGKTET